jgi:hypothetical protein
MLQCSRCGGETNLCLAGIPICVRCDELIEQMAADLISQKSATPKPFLLKKQGTTAQSALLRRSAKSGE